jgi:hypothetical protein
VDKKELQNYLFLYTSLYSWTILFLALCCPFERLSDCRVVTAEATMAKRWLGTHTDMLIVFGSPHIVANVCIFITSAQHRY